MAKVSPPASTIIIMPLLLAHETLTCKVVSASQQVRQGFAAHVPTLLLFLYDVSSPAGKPFSSEKNEKSKQASTVSRQTKNPVVPLQTLFGS